MRILTLTNFYPPHHYGGYELSCRDVMERLSRRGHDVAVLTSSVRVSGASDPPDERRRGVWRDLTLYWDDHRLISPPPHRRLAIERHNQRALRSALEAHRPDVVSAWNMGAVSLGLLATVMAAGIPLVLNVCNDWLVIGPRLDAWQRLFLQRRKLGRLVRPLVRVPTEVPDLGAATACFVSAFTQQEAEAQTPWTFPRSTVVYSGIERSEFPASPSRDRPWGWHVLYVGRLDPRKGLATLVAAFRDLPPSATLEVLGRGDPDFARQLVVLVEEEGLTDRVRFGVVEREGLAERYMAADVVVFPSEWEEPFGLVPVEAMACGTPVVATGTGGSGEFLVDGRNCLLYPAGDAGALRAALERLAADPGLRAAVVEGGKATADELDTDRLTDVLEVWHTAAAEGFPGGLPAHRPSIREHVG